VTTIPSAKKNLNDTSSTADMTPKRNRSAVKQTDGQSKTYKVTPLKVTYDENGKIKCPVFVGGNLKILDFGTIDLRHGFHSQSNIYPIGFKSVRSAQSMFTLGARADFTNEIIEVDGKVMFKTTCSEEPDSPLVQVTCSGIWCEIVKRVNGITQARNKDKISISGPQMFGIAEYPVA
jgi:hypothetical protein